MATKMEQESKVECSGCSNCACSAATNELPEKDWLKDRKLIRIGAGAILFLIALVINLPFWARFSFYFGSYLLIGGDVLFWAAKNIIKGRVFDENFLMGLATIGAFAIAEYPEAVAVMLFYQIGEFIQETAVNRSRRSIATLMDIRPDFANLMVDGTIRRVSPEAVQIGDLIVIKPGEKVPLDGVVIDGQSALNTSALTGEPLPRDIEPGSEILSGSINQNGLITVKVSREFGDSTVSRILNLVEKANSRKAPAEQFITKFARYYTPTVVGAAVLLAVVPPLALPGMDFGVWFHRALIFLVVSCPCALVVSIPLSFFGGIGGASRKGILVKGGNYLDALSDVDTVVFDKTGTLTKGVFAVTRIQGNGSVSEADLLEYTAYAESYSNHPIALSIRKAYPEVIDQTRINDYQEIPGLGIKAKVKGENILAGNAKLLQQEDIIFQDEPLTSGSVIYVAINRQYAGFLVISDEIKEDSFKAVRDLKELGVKRLAILTGDGKAASEQVAAGLEINQVYAELLPDHKVEKLEMLLQTKPTKGKLLFVGDGINDAPVLARADIGVAMGGLGSDAAIEAADVVLMNDDPSKLALAIQIAKRTRGIVRQNIVFALGVKGLVLLLGAGGIATMWEAVFADVGVAVLATLNAMRVMRYKD